MLTSGKQTPRAATWTLSGLKLPLVLRTTKPMTDDELLRFSAENDGYRMERTEKGELLIMTPLGGDGGRWEALVIGELSRWAEENGGIVFSSNVNFSLPDGSARSPDTAWIAEERWNSLSPIQREKFPPLCPDFLIEVLSPSDSRAQLLRKMQVWMANGAKLAWMIDPRRATVAIYRQGQEPELLHRPDLVEGDDPVRGFRLALRNRWLS